MAYSLNKVSLIGHLGRDVEIKKTDNGRIANFTLATSESWKDKTTGEKKEKTEWHKIVVFRDTLIDVLEKYTKKGSKVYLEGQLQTRKWTDKDGAEKYTTEVVLSQFKGELMLLDGSKTGAQSHEETALNDSIPW
jgi:single-strand DNA-binding protein